tara:strand:+ start:329 stop:769 length:441 start_codon:yes stop_codon:yes gene_type:complete
MNLDFRTGRDTDHGEALDIRMFQKGGGKMLSATNFHAEFGERVMLWTVESCLPVEFKDRETGEVKSEFAVKFEEHPQRITLNKQRRDALGDAWGYQNTSYPGKEVELYAEPYRSANSRWTIIFRIPEQARRQDPNYPDQNQSNYQF